MSGKVAADVLLLPPHDVNNMTAFSIMPRDNNQKGMVEASEKSKKDFPSGN